MESEDDEAYSQLVTKANKKRKKSGGFQAMGLDHQIFKGIMTKGYRIPTPIQRKAIPLILSGKDVVAMSRTGSGKTAAFLIPMFQSLKCRNPAVCIRALIVSPTRELAMQTFKFVKELGKFVGLKAITIVGGDSMEHQFAAIHENPDVLIATPGRLLHVVIEMNLSLKSVAYVVFDEADRLFELGFEEQLREILNRLPGDRQTLLFSATLPRSLVDFAQAGLSEPTLVRLDVDSKLSDKLTLAHIFCRQDQKLAVLLGLLEKCDIIQENTLTLIFCATKHFVEYLYEVLQRLKFKCTYLYSSMDAEARRLNVNKFRRGEAKILVVTDLASRGVDIPFLHTVINYHFPAKPKLFVHRVGRVARAGSTGQAISIISSEEYAYLLDLYLFLGRSLQFSTKATETKSILRFSLHFFVIDNFLNSMKQYGRSKPLCSSESSRRAKSETRLKNLALHPINTFTEVIRSKFYDSASSWHKKKKKAPADSSEVADEYFVPFAPSDLHSEQGYMPFVNLSVDRNSFAATAESAVVDFLDDDAKDIRARDNRMKWDRKRKRYVGSSGEEKTKKIKTESGVWISASYKSDKYKAWRQKLKMGALERSDAVSGGQDKRLKLFRSRKLATAGFLPLSAAVCFAGKGKAKKSSSAGRVRNELKSEQQIFKAHIRKQHQREIERRRAKRSKKPRLSA
ncbi:ATP dependent RNA helicase DDX54 [Trichuris trichiura]|uniref:RNA helicase n=1 Tax=Trichuris trichiura TaxID=36087 RepID=A0A077YVJ0_TRITR|nr:ATP dependent RNA helicase DDX54 [Trichuris trichiura]